MADSGVTRETALRALRAGGVDVSADKSGNVTLAGEITETIHIPDELGSRMVWRLADRYKVPIHWFYNPLMIPGEEDKRRPC